MNIVKKRILKRRKTKIALPTHHGILIEEIKSIIHCQSDNTYTTFHFENQKKVIISKPLADFEKILSGRNFFRIHKSHLINLNFVTEYKRGKGGQVKMINNTIINVSPKHKEELIKLLNNL